MQSTASQRRRGLGRDQRGAMMVMGIFVCTFLVGAMWTIAGLGEAVVMRDRMQEASDATALAAATIDSRAMNILVLFNLVMAAVLSIRVMLNALIAAAVAVSVFFGALGAAFAASVFLSALAPPLLAIAAAAGLIAIGLANIRDNDGVDQEITNDLDALELGAAGIASSTPPLAANNGGVAALYQPMLTAASQLTAATGAGASRLTVPLPVLPGDQDSLCDRAWDASQSELADILTQSGTSHFITGLTNQIYDLILAAGRLFGMSRSWCELSSTTATVPDPSQAQANLRAQQCNDPANQPSQCGQITGDQQLVDQLSVDGGPGLQAAKNQLQSDTADCNSGRQACQDGANKGSQPPPPGSAGPHAPVGNEQPYVSVTPWFANGNSLAQIFSWVSLEPNTRKISYAPQLVKIALGGAVKTIQTPPSYTSSYSQAEYFYQCNGTWGAPACNQGSAAMWNYGWHSRLRLYNSITTLASTIDELGLCITGGVLCIPDGLPLVGAADAMTASGTVSSTILTAIGAGASDAQTNLRNDINALMAGPKVLVVH